MARGDHLVVQGTLGGIPYQHHGIDLGDGSVIHLAPQDGARVALWDASSKFSVRLSSLDDFAAGRPCSVVRHEQPLDPDAVVAKAKSMLGQTGYSLLDGNCEHFATLCATGRAVSRQVEMGQATLASLVSATTKAFWWTTSRVGGSMALKGAVKLHPAALAADAVEVVALAIVCHRGLNPVRAKKVARVSGNLAALGVGAIVGGPVGAGVFLATHASSTNIADHLCKIVRRGLDHARPLPGGPGQ